MCISGSRATGKSRAHVGTVGTVGTVGGVGYASFSASELWQASFDARNRKRFEFEPQVWDSAANVAVRPRTETRYDGVGTVLVTDARDAGDIGVAHRLDWRNFIQK